MATRLPTEDRLARVIEDADLDESLVHIEPNIADHIERLLQAACTGRTRLVLCEPMGQFGNYLFELEAQPGGPRGGQL